jgi:phosphoglycolate phosphatase
MPKRAILFDLDGTLIDQFQAIHRAFSLTLSSMGYPEPSFDAVKRAVGGASDTTMEKLIGKERANEAVVKLRPIFEKEMLNGLIALPGACETLNWCKLNDFKTAVLTNKYGPHARAVCSHLGFDQFLEFTIGAEDTAWKKPNKELTLFTLDKIGFSSEETIYIGDSPYDYNTAQNASMDCILVATGTHSKEELSSLDAKVEVHIDLTSVISSLSNFKI